MDPPSRETEFNQAVGDTLRNTHARFHTLTVGALERLTDDSVAITFDLPAELRAEYAFTAGQHLTIRTAELDGEVRRSYSICSAPLSGRLRVAVKAVPDGVFSGYALATLAVGDRLDVMTPAGRFGIDFDPGHGPRHYAMVVAGSGITPVLSLMAAALETEPQCWVTLLYGNRTAGSVMFTDEIADLKDRYPGRLQVMHVLSREATDVELFSGRLDPDRLERIFGALLPVASVDEWFLCGPFEMVMGARDLLTAHGARTAQIHLELFHVEDTPRPRKQRAEDAVGEDVSQVTIVLDGRASTFPLERDTASILDAAMSVRPDLPFACKGGVCGTCRCRLVEGEVEMERNFALEPSELDRGLRLACQSRPLSDSVTVDFDV